MTNIHPSTNAPHGARTFDLPIPRRTPYTLGHDDRCAKVTSSIREEFGRGDGCATYSEAAAALARRSDGFGMNSSIDDKYFVQLLVIKLPFVFLL
ncbi:hypothetical protein DPMN_167446 [Dreissena polymorpha]|uniref:Uncharacterized protein n=1 Tax=Dreissena polymorpha TaxID=45954 RepID=A0A9D4F0T5_DREPO|nr:hypothetical protein DPMN_167446 [Dreissena polymorpha]